jgi:hypothetical protein
VSDAAPACINCGRPLGQPRPVGAPSAAAADIGEPGAGVLSDGSTVAEHEFFQVGVQKFVVLSLCTLGLYELYWCYKNWHRIKARTRETASPFWRGAFAPLWGFSLFRRIHERAIALSATVDWNANALGAGYLLLSACWRLPSPWSLISLGTFIPFIPVLKTVRMLNSRSIAAEGSNESYSGANIATIVFGGIVLILAILGSLLPPGT